MEEFKEAVMLKVRCCSGLAAGDYPGNTWDSDSQENINVLLGTDLGLATGKAHTLTTVLSL